MNLLAKLVRPHLLKKANLFSPKDHNPPRSISTKGFSTAMIRYAFAFDNLKICAAARNSFYLMTILFAFIFLSAAPIRAAQVALAWNPNNPAPDGYRLYKRSEGQTYDYASPEWTGKDTTCTVTNLADGVQYYFVVRAYVGVDESGDSNEVGYLPPGSNYIPVAHAGADQIVQEQKVVTLDGLLSTDADDDPLTYTWTQVSGPPVELSNPSDARPNFAAPEAIDTTITLLFQLTVTDPGGLSSTDTCQVVIEATQPPNETPEAEAGSNQIVVNGQIVHLNGSASDPENDPLTCQWEQRGGPTVQLSAVNVLNPTFTAPMLENDQSATLIFELQVSDDHGHSAADTCIVQVQQTKPADTDGDGVVDAEDAFPKDPFEQIDTDLDGLGNNADSDDDNDGMPDKWEDRYGMDPLTDDSHLDTDMDGMTNMEEYLNGTDPTQSNLNLAPAQPEVLYPWNGATDISTTPNLEASDFNDPDAQDSQAQSEWRIIKESNTKTMMHIIKDNGQPAQLRVPKLILHPNSVYSCQVRYYDNHGNASEWSLPVRFTTQVDQTDKNRNGVPDTQDVSDHTDLDRNSIPDLQEPQVMRSVLAIDEQYEMAVDLKENDANTTLIDGAETLAPATIDNMPAVGNIDIYGILTFRVQVESPGQEIMATIFLSGGLSSDTQWLSQNVNGDWVDCSEEITFNDDGRSITRQLEDGGEYDVDGVVNGTIIHAIGPIVNSAPQQDPIDDLLENKSPSSDSGTPESNGCFIGLLLN